MREGETTTSIPARGDSAESATIPVKRRRRRRTAACVQCRSRKLKCDQEYPTCGRCAKGSKPSECTYQDASHQPPATTGSGSSSSQQPPVGTWGESTTVRVPDRNGAASVPREQSCILSRLHPEIGVSTARVEVDEPGQCTSVSKGNIQHIDKHLGFFPSSKRRKTSRDGAAGVSGNLLEDDEHYARDYRSQRLEIPTKTYWRGKECSSRFYGSSIVVNMISEFTDLKAYAKEIKAENPVLIKFRHDLMAVKEKDHHQKHCKQDSAPSPIDSTFLFKLLPTRHFVETLVDDYLTYIEPSHRVLHIPTFRRELDTIWEQEPVNIQPTVLVQLLLILASAWSFHGVSGNTSTDEKSMTCETAKNWIRRCEAWLQNCGIKRPDPAILRIRCLIIVAKYINGTRKSQAWNETGSLVKVAMSCGYHREPDSQYAKISRFNREMRRRLWVTIVELDLQASLDRGMPPTVQQDDYDSIMPSNFNDEDIGEGDTPQPSPSNVATDSSLQVALVRSLPLRLKICALVNAPCIRISYEELHWLEGEVMRYLSYIPNWQPPHKPRKPYQQQQFVLWRTLIETKLGQSLLSLLSSPKPEASVPFIQSSRTRLEIATTILCQHQQLLSNDSDSNVGGANNKLSTLYPLTAAPLQAALVICHHLYTMDTGFTSKTIHAYLPSLPLSLLSLVEKTLASLEPRIVLIEKGLKEYYILSMIIGLVKTKVADPNGTPATSASAIYRKEAVDRAAVLGYRVLAKKREKHEGDWSAEQCPHHKDYLKKKKQKHAEHHPDYHDEHTETSRQPPQNVNATTTPISMEQTPPSLDNLPTNTGNGGEDLNNIQIPSLPQNFNFDFDFDWDFLLLDDVDANLSMCTNGVGNGAPYQGQNLGGDGFGNFY